ncbi:lysine-specific demethylase 5A-like [Argiope bruennichi]|uniref:lysine-specific demethylase 5A-like n=1 Tax=Argiope bruennichi TaxID=94029 RepID=UPI0024945FBD|nr:lysine-specific demethylase 5A-like [Argiope bruennichi]
MNAVDFEFVPPPEAPVFEPTVEEFKDPLAYIAKIRPVAEQTGICKIKPPPEWQPPFAVDVDNFRFTPRMQRLNELEATTRVKLNFLDQIAKFWELQGSSLKIPNVERKALDLFTLYRVVLEEGGSEIVSRERRWSRIATRMGYPPGRGVGSLLRQHYERILYPYHVFQEGTSIGDLNFNEDSDDSSQQDKDYIPHGIPSRQAIKPPVDRYARRSKRCKETEENLDGIDYSTNNELKKLQFYGAGPKMPGYHIQGHFETEEESKAFLKENHVECFKDVKMGLGAKDLKMGFGTKLTGSFLKETKTMEEVEAVKLGVILKRKDKPRGKMPIDQIVCNICGRGDEEASMLLCDGCDDSYHTFCLIPPLSEIPKGDWRCPCCVAKEVNKPQEAFGFEQAQREYTLQEFGQKADEFKTNYFNMPVHRVPYSHVEKEFWRIVNAVDEDVTVEYGADLHTIEHGSGFPNMKTKDLMPGDEEYVTSGWNLNNLPVLEGSVLKHINADISGMKIPWTYVGMCFATFCWHNEDHWSYSINYLHWGEPKTWYGVPGGKAEAFEEAMRSVAPELFTAQPDLLHQLVTIMNPNLLISQGVPIFRTNQQAGEFVITFPRSYHAGFNQGYNFAEAVNFAPADWLPIGRVCVSHYGMLHRFCVFSHDELVCKMATDPDRLDISIAASTYQDMLRMVETEKALRKTLLEWGVTSANREVFELLPDDERQCSYCKTTCFLSAVTCSCNNNQLVCIHHRDKLCSCPPEKHCLLYRYTLDELPTMLYRLKVRAESFDCWSTKVQNALNAESKNKLGISELKELMLEAEEKRFPCTDLLQNLNATIDEGEKCAALAQQLLSRRIRTRTRQCGEVRSSSRLTLEDLHLFHQQLSTLACEIKEAFHVKDLLDRAVAFQVEAQEILAEERPDSRRLEKCMEVGINLDIEIPEICQLKQKLEQSRWLEEVRGVLLHPDRVTLQVLGGLLERGVCIPPDPTVEKVMAELQELLTFGEKWEEKARSCLQAKPKHPLSLVEAVVRDAGNISVHLPNVLQLTEAVRKAKEWLHKVQLIQNEAHNPYLEVLEQLVWKGRPVPIRLEQLSQIETQVEAARAWKEKTARTFLKKNSSYSLLEVLSPRKDIGMSPKNKKKRKELDDSEDSIEAKMEEIKDPATIVAHFREAERRELEAMILLRAKNERKRSEDRPESRYCICHKPYSSGMVQCELCKDCFHVQCMPPSRTVPSGRKGGQTGGRWLCGCCLRSRRPRLETILSLLMALQKLPVRLAEGEALQCLTERGMAWQDRAKQALKSEEVASAFAALSAMSQQKTEITYCEKSEQIVHTELQKVSNPTENKSEDLLQRWRNLIPSDKCEGKELPVPETPPKIETVDLTGESAHTDTEHAYSSASKTAAATVTPRKHARKSPLVARQMESPVLQLSESVRQQLEQLLMEGDLLEMSLDESGDIWRILQATRADFSLSPFSDIEENVRIEKKKTKKIKLEETRSNILKSKVTKTKKPEKQRRKKLRLEGGEMKRPKPRSGEFHFQKEMKDGSVKTVKMRAKLFDSKKPRRKGEQRRDKEGEDFCSAAGCLRPIGEAVNWVQCDGGCEQWFHLLCVGLDMSEVSETEDYICPNCARQSKDEQAYSEESDASEVAASVLAGFAKNSFTVSEVEQTS